MKLLRTLSSFYSDDITWFTISSDIDGADRVFCHLCNDVKGRRVTTTISSFTGLHCDKEHKNMFQEWKTKHPDHPFQKKIGEYKKQQRRVLFKYSFLIFLFLLFLHL